MDKWVLWAAGNHHWSTASDNYHQAMRLALKHFGVPETELFKDDKIVSNRWMAFIKDRHDGACLIQASPKQGAGKTVTTNKGELTGFRMGNSEKVYPIHILHLVYDEPAAPEGSGRSTYVTRGSAEAAINSVYYSGTRAMDAIAMLEDKPRERVKAR